MYAHTRKHPTYAGQANAHWQLFSAAISSVAVALEFHDYQDNSRAMMGKEGYYYNNCPAICTYSPDVISLKREVIPDVILKFLDIDTLN